MVESGQRERRISVIQGHTLRRARGVAQWGDTHAVFKDLDLIPRTLLRTQKRVGDTFHRGKR